MLDEAGDGERGDGREGMVCKYGKIVVVKGEVTLRVP